LTGSINAELEAIKKAIRSTEGISLDNICYIYNQFAGGTIRRLSEMNIATSGIFFSHGNVGRALPHEEFPYGYVFEDIAAEVNISYSYMRKIVREKTGKSVNETVNFLRIRY